MSTQWARELRLESLEQHANKSVGPCGNLHTVSRPNQPSPLGLQLSDSI